MLSFSGSWCVLLSAIQVTVFMITDGEKSPNKYAESTLAVTAVDFLSHPLSAYYTTFSTPYINNLSLSRTFNSLYPPPMWYMMKCVYLLLSAQQIRCGYPRRIIGNFLCKSYRFLNMLLFRWFVKS